MSLTLRNRETGGVKGKSDVWCESVNAPSLKVLEEQHSQHIFS